jgi:hypothetical protein
VLDVDTPTGVGVSYRVSRNLRPAVLGTVASLPPGFHPLPSQPASGAIDYLRSQILQDCLLWWTLGRPLGRLGQSLLRLAQWPMSRLPSRFPTGYGRG